MAKWQQKAGHEAYVHSYFQNDPFGTLPYYGFPNGPAREDLQDFYNKTLELAADYDILHVHFLYGMLPLLREAYPGKKIVMHYHGGDVRRAKDHRVRIQCEKAADYVLAAHPEVHAAVPHSTLIPTIIDTDLFKPIEHGTAKFIMHWSILNWELINKHLEKLKLGNVDVLKREDKPRPYYEMPKLFAKYGTYVNIIYSSGVLIESFSKTALECLACGLDVIDWDGKTHRGLPEEHKPQNVLKALPYM